MPPGQVKFETTVTFCVYLSKLSDTAKLKEGIDKVIAFRNQVPESDREITDPVIKTLLAQLGNLKGKEITDYIKNALP